MTRLATLFRVAPLAFLLVLGTPLAVRAQEKTELEKLSERVKDLEKKFQDQKDSAASSQVNLLSELSAIKLNQEKLAKQLGVDLLKDGKSPSTDTVRKITNNALEEELKEIDKLKAENRELRSKLKEANSESRRIDTLNVPKPGKVRLINLYQTNMSVFVNSRFYDIPPGQELTVTVPVGTFNYQAIQLQSSLQFRQVKENETFTIEIK